MIVAAAALVLATMPSLRTSAELDDALPARAILPTEIPSPRTAVAPSVAPGYQAPQTAPSAAELVGIAAKPFVGISLQDAVAMALVKNPNVAVSASNFRIARYRVVQAKANFDVELRVEPSSSFSVTPPENIFFAGPGTSGTYLCYNSFLGVYYPCATTGPGNIVQHQYSFQAGVTGQSVNGTTFGAGITQTRTYNNTIINTFNPYYQASLSVSVTQPLLRNLGMNALKRQLKLSFIDADFSEAQTLLDTSNTLAQVEDAYWDLVAAWRSVAIGEEALNEAVVQQRSVVRLAKRGAAAPIAAVESETQVANFQSQVFSALQAVSQLQNQLKSLIASDSRDPIWQANLVPSSPVQQLPGAADLGTIVAQAERNRPEVRQVQDQHRQADLDRVFAKNQALPQADVIAQYMSNGFAGQLAPVPYFESQACGLQGLPSGCPTPPPQTAGQRDQGVSQPVGGNLSNLQHRLRRQRSAREQRRPFPRALSARRRAASVTPDAESRPTYRKRGAKRSTDVSIGPLAAFGGDSGSRRRGVRLC